MPDDTEKFLMYYTSLDEREYKKDHIGNPGLQMTDLTV